MTLKKMTFRNINFLILILALFTIFSFILFYPIFLGKVNLNGNLLVSFYSFYGQNLPYKNSGWDQLRIYFPFYKITLEALKSGSFPLWNPYAFSGHPHLADFQSATLYPINVFGSVLPQIEFWHLLRVTPTIFGAFFTFIYLRSLKLSNLSSVFGAFTFGFSPFILTWGEEVVMSVHSVIWLPLILYGIERYLRTKNKKFLALMAVCGGMSFFAGYMQTTIYLFIFVIAYLVLRVGYKKLFSSVTGLRLLAATAFCLPIALAQLLPSAELYFQSARSQIALKESLYQFLLPIESILTYLAPDFFGSPATYNFFRSGSAQYYEGILFTGISSSIFAAYAFFSKAESLKRQRQLIIFLSVTGLISLSTAFDLPTSKIFLSLPIPFLSTSITNRILFIPAFCIAVLAAIGVETWLNSSDKKIMKIVCNLGVIYVGLIVIIFTVWVLHFPYYAHGSFTSQANLLVSFRNLVIPITVYMSSALLITLSFLMPKFKKLCLVFIILISSMHILHFSVKYFSFTERKNVFPETSITKFIQQYQGFDRSWGPGDYNLQTNFASQYSIYWPEGYDSLNNSRYGQFTYAMQGASLSDFIFRADAGIGTTGKAADLLGNPSRRRLLDMLGVKHVVANTGEADAMAKKGFKKVFEDGELSVFENMQAMPRVYLASKYEDTQDILEQETQKDKGITLTDLKKKELTLNRLLSADFDFRNVVILEKPSYISPDFGVGSAHIVSYKPQEVIVKTKSDKPKILVLSDNYYSGWEARVDGEKSTILRANYTFKAVALSPGEHLVKFYYDPLSFKIGVFVSFLSLILLGYFALTKNRILG